MDGQDGQNGYHLKSESLVGIADFFFFLSSFSRCKGHQIGMQEGCAIFACRIGPLIISHINFYSCRLLFLGAYLFPYALPDGTMTRNLLDLCSNLAPGKYIHLPNDTFILNLLKVFVCSDRLSSAQFLVKMRCQRLFNKRHP